MANEEHRARLQQGVAAWNQWRAANFDIKPDPRRHSSPRRASSGQTSTGRTSTRQPLPGQTSPGRTLPERISARRSFIRQI
jgi:hypothetical protein